ncbi:MAG: hypothetical protein KKB37_09145 [Alphaproteobacteria bacterium]|nr:hypothetical protein [Alphaproteobacteria bacterium]
MMRFKHLAAGLSGVLAVGILMPSGAMAFGKKHYDGYSGYDPFAYRYEHRGYYPYYGSHYWRPAYKVPLRRFRYRQPRYYKAWGYYKPHRQLYHHGHPHGTPPHGHRKHHW